MHWASRVDLIKNELQKFNSLHHYKSTCAFGTLHRMLNVHWLDTDPNSPFPPLEQALTDPNGLLAVGGDLSSTRLLNAYKQGVFPWYNPGEPILWWSPDPRCVLYPPQLKISRSLHKTLNKQLFEIRFDSAFIDVMLACAQPREKQAGTWITRDMLKGYVNMHEQGFGHSIECWQNNRLVGGLYGLAIGRVFFGESMFSLVTDASKVALVTLCQWLQTNGYELIDSQVHTPHLESMGAQLIPRADYAAQIKNLTQGGLQPGKWTTPAAKVSV